MNQIDSETKRRRIETLVKVGIAGLICILVAPFTFAILHGIFGILGAFVAYGICYTGMMFAPVAGRMIANWRLKALKAEASRNPVETLQNVLVQKRQALQQYRAKLIEFKGQRQSFADEVVRYEQDGLEDAPVYRKQLQKMEQLESLREQKFSDATQAVDEFEQAIERTQRKWEMACAAAKMNEAAGEITGDTFDKICTDTAIGAVQNKLNEQFAELDMALLDNKPKVIALPKQGALPEPQEDILEAQPVLEKVKRK